MGRIILYLFAFMFTAYAADAATNAMRTPVPGRVSKYVDQQSYAYMYPYLNNKMRTAMNPGTTVNMTNNPIDVVVRTKPMAEPRRVVPRTQKSTNTNNTARATTNTASQQTTRRVVQRTANTSARAATTTSTTARAVSPRGARSDTSRTAETTTVITNEPVSSTRCLADYTTCMNGYCARKNTAYNRCFCSAKLSQIDATYQPQISDLIVQIINLRGGGTWTQDEMNEYWMELVGNYAGENSWVNLDNALNIDWSEPEERMRGQNAFLTGHQYCVQHLRACAYMSSNLRDAYRSQISRDCAAYEQSLERIKTAAEALIEYYSE
ncbi:MAG: hypothetical protein IJQ90_03025 [Alphaproteobacteria bacterium]|nr:hypothetical protein [Alphaproteobacteria bacterium]